MSRAVLVLAAALLWGTRLAAQDAAPAAAGSVWDVVPAGGVGIALGALMRQMFRDSRAESRRERDQLHSYMHRTQSLTDVSSGKA